MPPKPLAAAMGISALSVLGGAYVRLSFPGLRGFPAPVWPRGVVLGGNSCALSIVVGSDKFSKRHLIHSGNAHALQDGGGAFPVYGKPGVGTLHPCKAWPV